MGTFNTVTKESLDNIQINAGMILKTFSPSAPSAPSASNIVCATTGGIQANCVPSYEDFGADIDNCPNNTLEMKKITGWECTFSFTALDINEETIKLALGACGSVGNEIQPKADVIPAYFKSLWFVSERVDDKIVAIQLKNAISTGGFSYKTQKNAKGQLSVTLTGHISIEDEETVPMLFYICSEDASRMASYSLAAPEDDE